MYNIKLMMMMRRRRTRTIMCIKERYGRPTFISAINRRRRPISIVLSFTFAFRDKAQRVAGINPYTFTTFLQIGNGLLY